MIDGNIDVKCRFAVRGFKDRVQDLDVYAGTTSRSGQRLANAVAVENPEFILFSFDLSQAFAKSLTFEELSASTGTELRQVEFHVPKFDLDCLRYMPGFSDYIPSSKILTMLKPIYGLKDAPRAWRKKLHQVLTQWMSCRQLHTEPEFYCVHKIDEVAELDIYHRVIAHNEEQQESGKTRLTKAQQYIPGSLQCVLGLHLDNIKGTARSSTAESLLARLNDTVGKCKADCGCLMRTGIQHEHTPGPYSFTSTFILIVSNQSIIKY